MNTGFLDAFTQIIREKRVDKNTLVETIKVSLVSAAKRKYGAEAEIQVRLDESKGTLEIFRVFKIVKEVEDADLELTLEQGKKIDEDAKVGGEIKQLLPIEEFGRNAVQTARQVLMQRVRDAERERIYEDYKDKINVIVSGSVRQVDRGNILVNLGRAEAYLPQREQIRKERYNQGDSIRAVIIEVDKDTRGPQIILSRTSELFLRKLFEQEVPEIFDGDVEIKSIAREPGGRSKIAVYSRSEKVDAVGSCVGMKGSRVQAVVNELHGEKIDIVNWSENSSEFVSRALAPAKVSSLRFNEAEGDVLAIVEDDQLSLAIGREGQNVRLASRLAGWKIDLITVKEVEQRDKLEQKLQMDIGEMYGVSPKMAQKLKNFGIFTVQKLHRTTPAELQEIEGIGTKITERLKATATETMEELDKALQELLEKEKAIAAAEQKQLFDEAVFGPDKEEKKPEAPITEKELFKDLDEGEAEKKEDEEDSGEEETSEEAAEPVEDSGEGETSEEAAEPEEGSGEEETSEEAAGPEEDSGEEETSEEAAEPEKAEGEQEKKED